MTMNSRKTLEKKQLKSLFWRSFTTSHAWHYERQQHMAFEFAMIPVINKLYDKEEDRIDAYKRHMEFYNCQTAMQPFICGVAAAMEEENANNEEFDTSSISAMKVALMGPLAGIGDSLIGGTLRVIATGIVHERKSVRTDTLPSDLQYPDDLTSLLRSEVRLWAW